MQIIDMIDDIQRNIFDFEVEQIPVILNNIMMDILNRGNFDSKDSKKIQEFNHILQGCLQALQNKDYLLLADTLEYNLKPFLGYN